MFNNSFTKPFITKPVYFDAQNIYKTKLDLEQILCQSQIDALPHKNFSGITRKINYPTMVAKPYLSFSKTNSNLGFLDAAAGLVGTLATTATSVYKISVEKKLAEKQMKIEYELANRRLVLEEELAKIQRKILTIQADGLEKTQDLSIMILESKANLEKAKLENELEVIKREQEMWALKRELEEKKISFEKAQIDKMQESLENMDVSQSVSKLIETKLVNQPILENSLDIQKKEENIELDNSINIKQNYKYTVIFASMFFFLYFISKKIGKKV